MVQTAALKRAFHEVASNPPTVVQKTRRKSGAGAARKQSIAIALSKARKMGAMVPYAGVVRG